MQKKPVIVILKTINICKEFHKKLQSSIAYVFDTEHGDATGTFGILSAIQNVTTEPYPVILTTAKSSLGFSFFMKAHVILTDEPANYTEYTQLLGRSDRTGPDETKYGTLFSSRATLDQRSLEQGLMSKDQELILMHRDQRDSLLKLNEYVNNCTDMEHYKEHILTAIKGYNSGKTAREWRMKLEEQVGSVSELRKESERSKKNEFIEETRILKKQKLSQQQ